METEWDSIEEARLLRICQIAPFSSWHQKTELFNMIADVDNRQRRTESGVKQKYQRIIQSHNQPTVPPVQVHHAMTYAWPAAPQNLPSDPSASNLWHAQADAAPVMPSTTVYSPTMDPQVATGTMRMDWLPMDAALFVPAMPVSTDNRLVFTDLMVDQNSLVAYQGPVMTGDQPSTLIQPNQVEHGPGHPARLDSIRENDERQEDEGHSEDVDIDETEEEDDEDANKDRGERGPESWGAGGGGVTIL